jgi:hypothetical protein
LQSWAHELLKRTAVNFTLLSCHVADSGQKLANGTQVKKALHIKIGSWVDITIRVSSDDELLNIGPMKTFEHTCMKIHNLSKIVVTVFLEKWYLRTTSMSVCSFTLCSLFMLTFYAHFFMPIIC